VKESGGGSKGLIDLHAHILPGFDDGAKDQETSLSMARQAAKDGITSIGATPHVINEVYSYNRERILEAVEGLNQFLDENGVPVHILPGAEYRLEPDLPQRLDRGELLTLNDSNYLLVELPATFIPSYTERVLYELQLQGITPIIAHPERNAGFAGDPSLLFQLVSKGVLVQITAGSLTGMFGRTVQKTAFLFLNSGLSHLIASDAHSSSHRTPVLSVAARAVEHRLGAGAANCLVLDNPRRIIESRGISLSGLPELRPPRPGFKNGWLTKWLIK